MWPSHNVSLFKAFGPFFTGRIVMFVQKFNMKTIESNFSWSFEAVRRDLVAHLYTLGHTIDSCLSDGAGSAMLGLPTDRCWPPYDEFDLSPFCGEGLLRSLYRYVKHGEQDRHYSDDEEERGPASLRVLLALVAQPHVAGYFDEVTDLHDLPGQERGGFAELLDLAETREFHDRAQAPLTLDQLALLAGIDRRTVNNAMYASGAARLTTLRKGHGEYLVEPAEARRWLMRRSNFVPTVDLTAAASDETCTVMEAVLSEAGIRNGYIDFDMNLASRFFPGDAFGSRASDERGITGDFMIEDRTVPTDIRIKSRSTASPRMRFSAWFRRLRAQPGDRVRLERLDERCYRLEFVTAPTHPAND